MKTTERIFIFPVDPLYEEGPALNEMEIEVEAIAQLARNRFYVVHKEIDDLRKDMHAPYDAEQDYEMHARLRRLKALANQYYGIFKPLDMG